MENIREKALKILTSGNISEQDICNSNLWEGDLLDAMIEFANIYAYDKCEEQKKECAENAEVVLYAPSYPDDSLYYKLEADEVYVNKESILNVPNVCKI